MLSRSVDQVILDVPAKMFARLAVPDETGRSNPAVLAFVGEERYGAGVSKKALVIIPCGTALRLDLRNFTLAIGSVSQC